MKRVRDRIKKKAENDKPKLHVMTKRDKPLTSEYELKKTRQEINATNRRRAKNMERDVARYLKGKRVPSSGAIAGMKGDCTIPLENSGFYLVECKMSAAQDKYGNSKIVLTLDWFDKVLKDAQSMNARFGILVIHYFGKKEDYVFVHRDTLAFIRRHFDDVSNTTLDTILRSVIPKNIINTDTKKRSAYGLYQKALEESFIIINGIKSTAFVLSSGIWHVFTLEQFRDLMEGV